MDPARGAKLSTWLNDQRVRGLIYQTLLLACVAALAYGAIHNALTNMRARGIPMGFGFWNQVAGFDINLHLINYTQSVHVRQGVLGRAAQYPSHRCHLHSARDAPGFCDRRRPAFTQLAAVATCARLHQHPAQHPAAAPAAVLVQRGSQIPARPPTVDHARRCRISQ